MNRFTLVLLTFCATIFVTQPVLAAKKVFRWRLAESWPTNFPIFGDTSKQMVKLVKEMSNGRLIIQIHSKNKHKAPFGIFDMVKTGQYQMGHSAAYYWKNIDTNTMFFTTMPFGMVASESYAWFYYGGGMALMKKVFSRHNMLSFPGGNTGNQMGGWFKREINSIDDLQGLRIRIPGFAGEILAELGAKPVNIPAGELYTALKRNTIDAVEWVGPSLDLRMGFHKIAPFYYTGWHEPATELQFMVNSRAYHSLPKDLQQILTTAMKASAFDMYARSIHESGKNLAKINKNYPAIKIKTFPREVMLALRKKNQQLLDQFAEKDALTKEIIQSQRTYQKQVRAWTKISDQAYLNSAD